MNKVLENLFPMAKYPGVTLRGPDMEVTTQMYPEVSDNPLSFGKDFNLIRAVQEYGPKRIAAIEKELHTMEARASTLEAERIQLQKLVEAVSS